MMWCLYAAQLSYDSVIIFIQLDPKYNLISSTIMGLTRVLVKDGGFGTQMTVHVGHSVDGDPLWSARFNATNPTAVINTHLDFLQSKWGTIILDYVSISNSV